MVGTRSRPCWMHVWVFFYKKVELLSVKNCSYLVLSWLDQTKLLHHLRLVHFFFSTVASLHEYLPLSYQIVTDNMKAKQPSRSLRSSNQLLLTVHHANLTISQRAFCHSSPVIWNSIPLSATDASSIGTFKRHLKSFYFKSLVSLPTPPSDCPRHWFKLWLTVARYKFMYVCIYVRM